MKKQKSSLSKQGPIQLLSTKKSHSINLKHEKELLFTPYKIDWKTSNHGVDNVMYGGINPSMPLKQPFRNIQNSNIQTIVSTNSNSKAFYQNMKNQLSNIKQDVQKMIMRQKKQKTLTNQQSNQQTVNNQSQTNQSTYNNNSSCTNNNNNSSNGCIKTISIKNKCQKKMQRVESLYENVDRALNNRMGENHYSTLLRYNQRTQKQQKPQKQQKQQHFSPLLNNIIENQIHSNNMGSQFKYRSQKQTYPRQKSRSIADVIYMRNLDQKQQFCPLSMKFLSKQQKQQKQHQQNIEEIISQKQSIQENVSQKQSIQEIISQKQCIKEIISQKQWKNNGNKQPDRQKIELDIRLPSFQKFNKQELKSKQRQQINVKIQQQKQKIITQLKYQLNQLQKQLSLRDELMSRKEQSKSQLIEQIENLNKQLLQNKEKQQKDHSLSQQKIQIKNKNILKLQGQINNLKSHINTKDQQLITVKQENHLHSQKIKQLTSLLKQFQHDKSSLSSNNKQIKQKNNQIKQWQDQNKKLKDKQKLKENQIYIYQEELKQAKHKIKQLKQELNSLKQSNINPPLQNNNNLKSTTLTTQELLSNKEYQQILTQNQSLKTLNQSLKKQLQKSLISCKQTQQTCKQTQQKLNKILNQNTDLKFKISKLQQQSQNAIQQILHNPGFQNIGDQISKKFSALVDQNYSFKNKISHLQANLQQLNLKNKSFIEEIKIYSQKINNQGDSNRRLKIEDWDNLTDQRDDLKNQLQTVKNRLQQTKQFYELQTMRKQNQIYELNQRILQISDFNESSLEQNKIHPNIRSIKHIKNIDLLINQFRDMIQYNIEMKDQIDRLKNKSTH